jgi:hypothetical protein
MFKLNISLTDLSVSSLRESTVKVIVLLLNN